MVQKPGWTYFYKESLGQYIAINDQTDVMYTEDKTRYSDQETHLLKQIDYNIPPQVHIIKKLFNGTIISL